MTPAAKTIPTFPDLAGKVAVVTGSSRGIGAETARYLAANQVKVVINGRDGAALQRVVGEIESVGGEALAVIADCTKSDQIENMRRQVENRFGDIDLLMPFAGSGGPIQPIEDVSEEQWNFLLSANLTSKFLTIKSFLPGMRRRGAGSIVLMCSSAGRAASHAALAYSAAQAGVAMLARNFAQQLGRYSIRVNAIAPSAIRNDRMAQSMSGADQESLAKTFPIQRIGEPSDVAAAALFLGSGASSWITGITLDVAGGKVMV
ncbi:MAG: short-chain dehydrogenase [Acidobacteriaceae bacterium]|nr:short-chain dehydrogenase [Acidobacteriaceae bacterium]